MKNKNLRKFKSALFYVSIIIGASIFFSSCKKEGCTYSNACNYDSSAEKDDGSCYYNCAGGGGSGSSSSGGGLCTNTCSYAYDGTCDDGGAGSSYSVCDYGSDCYDCGTRYVSSSSSSGSSGSSSSSSGSSSGQVTFYTKSDKGCGNITVTVSGYGSQSISSYYSSGISGCNMSGCANFTLSPGTYTYSASCSGYTWGPSTFTVTSGGCLKYELY